jgi:hypothetical protein
MTSIITDEEIQSITSKIKLLIEMVQEDIKSYKREILEFEKLTGYDSDTPRTVIGFMELRNKHYKRKIEQYENINKLFTNTSSLNLELLSSIQEDVESIIDDYEDDNEQAHDHYMDWAGMADPDYDTPDAMMGFLKINISKQEDYIEVLNEINDILDNCLVREDSSYNYTESNEVPSDQQLKKYYATLEINESASSQEIKDAYRKLIKFYHPDKFQQIPESLKRAESKTIEITEAYHQLIKISKKSKEQNRYTKNPTGKREKDYWRTNKESYETYDSSSKTETFDSRDTTNTYRTSEPSRNNSYQKKLDQLFWIRIIFSLVGGIYAGVEFLVGGFLIMGVLYVLSIIIGKAMKIPLPENMKNKIITHGTGNFFVYFFSLWIFLGFISMIYFGKLN